MLSPQLNRRQVIRGLGYGLGALALRGYQVQAAAKAHFTHGIASGDPLHDRVILWTRVIAGNGLAAPLEVTWQIATDRLFSQIIAQGTSCSTFGRDFTVKVDAGGLEANRRYYYRFIAAGETSPIGQTRTLPAGDVAQFKIGVASCSNYSQGYFNPYAGMAQADLDLVLHLGDYIYEHADGVYANPFALDTLARHVIPTNELLTLEDYRMRYGLYHTDVDLQNLHQRHPFICIWDDHEFANNVWRTGAENHNAGEGDFNKRIAQTKQAFYEWMPIRENLTATDCGAASRAQEVIFRSFQIGNLADLIMLDTRLHGRDKQLDYTDDMIYQTALFDVSDPDSPKLLEKNTTEKPIEDHLKLVRLPYDLGGDTLVAITDYDVIKNLTAETLPNDWVYLPNAEAFKAEKLDNPKRTILGADQEAWLDKALAASKGRGATWQIIGQQVLMGRKSRSSYTEIELQSATLTEKQRRRLKQLQLAYGEYLPASLDPWDGYPACRERVYQSLLYTGLNPVVLAGDTHNAWAFNLASEDQRPVGIEIGTPSISSPGLEKYGSVKPAPKEQVLRQHNAEIFYVDASKRGWAELIITRQETISQFHFVDTVLSRDYTRSVSNRLICKAGSRQFSKA